MPKISPLTGLRSPVIQNHVIQKTKTTKSATSIVARAASSKSIGNSAFCLPADDIANELFFFLVWPLQRQQWVFELSTGLT